MHFTVQKRFFNIIKLFKEVAGIDARVFPEALWGTAKNELRRFMKNPRSFLLLRCGKKAAGYMCYFPISAKLVQNIRQDDKIHDDDISHRDVARYHKGHAHSIYILSVAVDPKYQKTSAMKILARAFRRELSLLNDSGCTVEMLQATAVSDAGRRTLERFGLRPLKEIRDGYTVYEADYAAFERAGQR